MAVPEEIRAVKRPVNTIVIDHGGSGPCRYAVLERVGCKRVNGSNRPVTGGTVGHIINGVFVPCNTDPVSMSDVELKDYADAFLIDSLSKDLLEALQAHFHIRDALKIYILAALKVMYPGEPYKRLGLRYEKSWLSEIYPSIPLSKNTICTFLDDLGSAASKISSFMKDRVSSLARGQNIIIDGMLKNDNSHFNSLAHYTRKARVKGTKDITVLFAYDGENKEPLCSKVYAGNVIDSVTFSDFLQECGLEYGIVLADKGFPRSKASREFKERPDLHYLLPLKRDASRIRKYNLREYDIRLDGDKNQDLLAKKVKVESSSETYWLYSFYDRARAAKEEAEWFRRTREKGEVFSMEELEKKRKSFGTIVFESDVDKDPAEIYALYNDRWLVEEFFRHYKDENGFSDTRVHGDAAVIGSEFINFFASIMTSRLFRHFDSLGLFEKNSYKDLMTDLSQSKKVKGSDGNWLYVRLPIGIQEELKLLSLMEGGATENKTERKRGRPRKQTVEVMPKRKPGRPLGSKNKPKSE